MKKSITLLSILLIALSCGGKEELSLESILSGRPFPFYGSKDGVLSLDIASDKTIGSNSYKDEVYSIAQLPDDKVLVAGASSDPSKPGASYNDGFVARISSSGELDESFGTNGIFFFDRGYSDIILKVIYASDGIFAFGWSRTTGSSSSKQGAILKLTPSGQIDTSFGTDGYVYYDFGDNYSTIHDVKMLSDGKFIAFVSARVAGVLTQYLAKFNHDGSLDTSFGTNGLILHPVQPQYNSTFSGVFFKVDIDSNGRIITAGGDVYNGSPIQYRSFVSRHLADGSIDTSFNSNGVVTINDFPVSFSNDFIIEGNSIVLPVIAASSFNESYLYKINEDGSFDTRFGNNGRVSFEEIFPHGSQLRRIKRSKNSYVLSGSYYLEQVGSDPVYYDIVFLKLKASDGQLDRSFNNIGYYKASQYSLNRWVGDFFINDYTIFGCGITNEDSSNQKLFTVKFLN